MPLTSTYFKGREAYDKGAINELKAAMFFIQLGVNVYWPAARNGPVDFIIEGEGGLLRVQVKTATWVRSGEHSYLQARIRSANREVHAQSGHYDLLAVVFEDELWVIPAEQVTSSNICLRGSRPDRKPEAWDNFKAK